MFRFTLPESPRYLATHGRGDDAIAVLKRLGIEGPNEPLSTDVASDTKSDPFAVVFKMFPTRVIAGMICFTAFFGFAIGVGAWLPNIYMVEKGFTVTKSLQYILAMNFAVPCASIFMMYALDNFGRKITSVCAFIAAGVMVIVFANAGSDTALLVAGFVMVFFVQVAGNAMQIFTSEVFPTNARASGFGWASGVGRIATAFIIPGILLIRGAYGIETVFVCLAILLAIAAVMVTQLGPEAKRARSRRGRAADQPAGGSGPGVLAQVRRVRIDRPVDRLVDRLLPRRQGDQDRHSVLRLHDGGLQCDRHEQADRPSGLSAVSACGSASSSWRSPSC